MLTERLDLSPLRPEDLDDLYQIYSDPETWQHLPSGRHTEPSRSLAMIESSERDWQESGVGRWAIRLRSPEAKLPAGSFIGAGGLSPTVGGAWNLGYRLAPAAWGRGFATEFSLACLELAAQTGPEKPVTARVLENNPASATVLEKVGLKLLWAAKGVPEGVPEGPTTNLPRRIYADRVLDDGLLRALIGLG
ncbi:RimJ/RimL family protein N-acetyltransferase [Psychromicrobium silvestre]|uniref:RimJ/RimL family protein N-acetyltransferase n=1 Tax=Psychromicrobium silvestre TaxID=1645614 RepID=A0A7Y9S9V5_9MICC|nr:GNAT family N-acetyltransferase [Psychromicrobium silvestre]NYE96637.1 RimJ/RimL family protein N-acetyltransferase [Psychromicrobium silvestre]